MAAINVNDKGEHEVDLMDRLTESMGSEFVKGTEISSNERIKKTYDIIAERSSTIESMRKQAHDQGNSDNGDSLDGPVFNMGSGGTVSQNSKPKKFKAIANVAKVQSFAKSVMGVVSMFDFGTKGNCIKYGTEALVTFASDVDVAALTNKHNKAFAKATLKEASINAGSKLIIRGGMTVAKSYADKELVKENVMPSLTGATEGTAVGLGDAINDVVKFARIKKINKKPNKNYIDEVKINTIKGAKVNKLTYAAQASILTYKTVKGIKQSGKFQEIFAKKTAGLKSKTDDFVEFHLIEDEAPKTKKAPTVQEMKVSKVAETKPMVRKPTAKK